MGLVMQKFQQVWMQVIADRTLLAILGVSLVLRMIIAWLLPPGFDEAYYFLYTLNPDWSYFDHPPLVAATTGMGIALTGGFISQLTIRLGAVLLYTLTLALLYLCGKRLFSRQVAIAAVTIAAVTPIFHVAFGAMTLPDAPLMVFWLMSLYVAICEFFPEDRDYKPTRRLAVLGVCVGLACLGKYHGFVLGAGLIGFCLTSAKHRRAVVSPWALVSVGLCLLTLFPLVYWNHLNDWASFTFQAERGVPAKQFEWARFGKALGLEMLYLFPTIGLPLLWANLQRLVEQFGWVVRPLTPNSGGTDPFSNDLLLKRRLVLWVSAPVFIGFTLIGGYRQIFPTWAMPGFFTATLILAEYAVKWRWGLVKQWLIGTAIVTNLLMAVALSHVVLGTFQMPSQNQIAPLLPANANDDGSIELIDILQLRRGFAKSSALMQALRESDFVYTNRFHLSGHVGMALTQLERKPITCFDKRDMRGFAFWSTAEHWVGKTGLYLTTDKFQTRENSAAEYEPYFASFTKIGEVPLLRGGVEVDRIHVFQGRDMLKPFPRPDRATQGA
jgi:4-amino-4-deoxy-L-arabinose transferase-like glycosyltransferase